MAVEQKFLLSLFALLFEIAECRRIEFLRPQKIESIRLLPLLFFIKFGFFAECHPMPFTHFTFVPFLIRNCKKIKTDQ